MLPITCHFWNVGQGLFSSGKITLSRHKEFVWVYDCGSMDQQHISAAVKNMKQVYQNEVIDLLAISHFDKDHISGLQELLQQRKVKRWLLPYYPLWQRLWIALLLGFKPGDEEFEFVVNPAQFIINKYAEHFAEHSELLFVPPLPVGQEIGISEHSGESLFSFQYDDEDFEREFADIQNRNISIKLVDPTKPAIVNGVEFVPYNMPLKIQNPIKFQQQVQEILDSSQAVDEKIEALREEVYDVNFGANSEQRNKISLFLYVGKVNYKHTNLFSAIKFQDIPNDQKFPMAYRTYVKDDPYIWYLVKDRLNSKCAIPDTRHLCINPKHALLYTGDGYLKTKRKFQALQDALGKHRMERILIFQVPHHGSKGNAYIGLAQDIQPVFSIFSARGNKHHPHSTIFADFMHYNPILVNQTNGFYVYLSNYPRSFK